MATRIRAAAERDIDDALIYYRERGGSELALRFVAALESGLGLVQDHPHIGSLRFAVEVDIAEVRSWPLQGFPHLIFYVPDGGDIDVWRVLHGRRDVPAHLAEPEG